MNIAKYWETCLSVSYNKEILLNSISNVLKDFKEKKILDCACGTGFITQDLIQMGYDITCSDGSKVMLEQFKTNAENKRINTTPHFLLWSQLGETFPKMFDCVVCRGSSLIYASGWDNSNTENELIIKNALTNFYDCLKEDGLLYIDTTANVNLLSDGPESNKIYKQINGSKIQFEETVTTDKTKGIRTWESIISINDEHFSLKRYSLFLPHNKLIEMLESCSFRDIRKINLEGEHYDVFLAKK